LSKPSAEGRDSFTQSAASVKTAHQREVREHRSAGAKKGWAKRKARVDVPHDIQ
jgi:hypothetical protein